VLLAFAGLLVVGLYVGFEALPPRLGHVRFTDTPSILALAGFLTFPVSFVSGMVFTLLGSALHERLGREVVTAGALTLANTTGAAFGALAGGFLLLPGLGMERSFFVLAAAYGLAVLLLPAALRVPAPRPHAVLAYGAFGLYLFFWLLFPHGRMNFYMRIPLLLLGQGENVILAAREGLTETAVYVEQRVSGEPMAVRLVTNGFSMSATGFGARRYMGFYVYLPVALHPRPRSALLICYGVGSTARALVRSRELETIEVVDISREVVEMSAVVYPDPKEDPLRNDRVKVHVEDGRAFLALTDRRFDIITAEPPPPTNAGVVNLYSREFFDRVRGRLAPGGFATYWLPVHTLDSEPARAAIQAFCGAFPDCTLWNGYNLDWMLVGTNGATGPMPVERVRRQWDDPEVGADLRDLGFETPERMGATFLADAALLREIAGTSPPLTDNWPKRVGAPPQALPTPLDYDVLFNRAGARAEAFRASPEIARLWPKELVPGTVEALRVEDLQNLLFVARTAERPADPAWLHEVMTTTDARLFVLLHLESDPDRQRIARKKAARGERDAFVLYHLAAAALAERRFGESASLARSALDAGEARARFLMAYALGLDGRVPEIAPLLSDLPPASRSFLETAFGLAPAGSPGR
jgi:spermidine synthase